MSLPNSSNPQCPDCGKPSRRKRTNQDGRKIYDCVCGWSNTVKCIPRSPLKIKELNAIAHQLAVTLLQQSTYRRSYIDLAPLIGDETWIYPCDELIKDFEKLIGEKHD